MTGDGITMHIPPECAGQTVEVSFGETPDCAIKRVRDRSDGTTDWYRIRWADAWAAAPDNDDIEFEPWNRAPAMPVEWAKMPKGWEP